MTSDIQPGIEVSGIVVYPPIDYTSGSITAQIDASYWDWTVDFEPYTFSDLK